MRGRKGKKNSVLSSHSSGDQKIRKSRMKTARPSHGKLLTTCRSFRQVRQLKGKPEAVENGRPPRFSFIDKRLKAHNFV